MSYIGVQSKFGLEIHGIKQSGCVYWNATVPVLVQEALTRKECVLSADGAVIADTGLHTGRSPKDRFVVNNGTPEEANIDWNSVNVKISPEHFNGLYNKMLEYIKDKDLFVADLECGADPDYAIPVRVINEHAWQNLFVNALFRRPKLEDRPKREPYFTVICVPGLKADPATDGTKTSTFIVVDFKKRIVLVGGSNYAGEMKKSIFSVMNFILPTKGVLPMHCSANVGTDGDCALFFGLSGTGKTTLSSDPERLLIGDDEHGWSDSRIFNFEGGCYAKLIDLSQKNEPLIWNATHRFGAVLENVVYDPITHIVDLDDGSKTENTRGAYPLDFIDGIVECGYAGTPNNIFFLTADAYGVLPPISKLNPAQAMLHFLTGYTSKLAGTERGITEPQPDFSACFGSPFLPLNPTEYAKLLGEKIQKNAVNVWLLNTGWSGGPYGIGKRFSLPYSRAMVRAALTGKLNDVEYVQEPYFGLYIPTQCPEVPTDVLDAKKTWSDTEAYDTSAKKLAAAIAKNFEKYADFVSQDVLDVCPKG